MTDQNKKAIENLKNEYDLDFIDSMKGWARQARTNWQSQLNRNICKAEKESILEQIEFCNAVLDL